VVIVDTSVWVSHLRRGNPALEKLLLDAEVVCPPFVVAELACGNIKDRTEVLSLLQALPMVPIVTQAELLHFVDSHKLMGTGLGFVDVHLLASSRLSGIRLWTDDRKLKEAARKLNLLHAWP